MLLSELSNTDAEVILEIVEQNVPAMARLSEDAKSAEFASALLNCVTSERHIAEYLVKKHRRFCFLLLSCFTDNKVKNKTFAVDALNNMVGNLFRVPESFFYLQHAPSFRGIDSYASVVDAVFSEPKIFLNLEIGFIWERYTYPFNVTSNIYGENYLSTYTTALEKAVRAYCEAKSSQGNFGTARFFSNGFSNLIVFASFLPDTENVSNEVKVLVRKFLGDIGSVFQKSIDIYGASIEKNGLVSSEVIPQFDNVFGNNFSGSLCLRAFEFLDVLSRQSEHEDARQIAEMTFGHVLDEGNNSTSQIREALLNQIWEQIDKSLQQGSYPAISSIYFNMVRWGDPSRHGLEYKRARDFLYKSLLPVIKKKEEMLNKVLKEKAMLPPEMGYDEKKKQFFYQYVNSKVYIPKK